MCYAGCWFDGYYSVSIGYADEDTSGEEGGVLAVGDVTRFALEDVWGRDYRIRQ